MYTVVFLFFCLHDFRLDQHIGLEEIAKYDEEAKADANILLKEIIRYAKKAEIPVTKHSYRWVKIRTKQTIRMVNIFYNP